MCTIKDFFNFAKEKNFKIKNSLALNKEEVSIIKSSNLNSKNFFADLGIFIIEK